MNQFKDAVLATFQNNSARAEESLTSTEEITAYTNVIRAISSISESTTTKRTE